MMNALSFRLVMTTTRSAKTIIATSSFLKRNLMVTTTMSSKQQNDDTPITTGVTDLVDQLLRRTESYFEGPTNHHCVAFSGGVDSSLVLALLREVFSSSMTRSSPMTKVIHPVLGISPAVPQEQIEMARRVSEQLGFSLTEVRTNEGSDPRYIANQGEACLACKTHLYTSLQLVLDHTSKLYHTNVEALSTISSSSLPSSASTTSPSFSQGTVQLYNGTNADDRQDPTRVGLLAAAAFQVVSPLDQIGKEQVRQAARHLGLPNWNAAASPCLRSRLALGVEATQQHLSQIEKAERLVRSTLVSEQRRIESSPDKDKTITMNLRVRLLSQQRARIEVDEEFIENAKLWIPKWTPSFQELGFSSIHVQAFRSGSVSRPLDNAQL
jgi:pyridinium-3,5-biscarboxylic acid mononucleotide sulfurtransferase